MIRVSAPGKAILMGEHAAVYGRPALVAALDRRVHVTIEPMATGPAGQAGQVLLDLPALGVETTTTWAGLRASIDRPGLDASDLDASDRSHFVRAAFGEALAAADFRPDLAARIQVRSEFPVGSGFGSSAAIAVAIVRAVFLLAGRDIDTDTLHAVSLEIEKRQHGSPSGIDNATVIHGGLLWVERRDDRLVVSPLDARAVNSPILRNLRVFHTGEPAESTGEVVAAVRALRDRDVALFERHLQTMEDAAIGFRDLLLESDSADPISRVIDEMRRFEACLEAIGVVPPPVARRIRLIEDAGGAAKISGAGSLTGPGAGSLLVLHPDPKVLDAAAVLNHYERLDLRLGGEGVRVDEH